MRIFMSILLIALASLANAQSYPNYETTTVNDFAGLLSPEVEARIITRLEELKTDTNVEMTVVTLSRRAMFTDSQTLEEFATGLFNNWGIGNKTSNDGILVLVLRTDREMRVELGKAYGRDWDRVAEMIVDRAFLPLFKQEKYEEGIEKGVNDIVATIARPFHKREPAPEFSSDGVSGWWALLIPLPFLLVVLISNLKKWIAARRPCPTCGQRTLSIIKNVLHEASTSASGDGETVTTCSNCDYHRSEPYKISRRSKKTRSSSRSSFGGGSSGGGGASGKW